jgi:hypothetical protein
MPPVEVAELGGGEDGAGGGLYPARAAGVLTRDTLRTQLVNSLRFKPFSSSQRIRVIVLVDLIYIAPLGSDIPASQRQSLRAISQPMALMQPDVYPMLERSSE